MYDAIIVGARCAGSPTAMLLARQGFKVLLLDRSTFPSDTISTGGGEAWDRSVAFVHPRGGGFRESGSGRRGRGGGRGGFTVGDGGGVGLGQGRRRRVSRGARPDRGRRRG